ncbi:MAG TPA: hypothetical protein DEA91_08655, partial [Paenibacillus sp.]|nr:hypothetical protein [Paenibacillus sp.]
MSTFIGVKPLLSSMFEVTMSDNSKRFVAVTWDLIMDEQINKEGQFTVNGTIEGTNKKAIAEITVKEDPNIALKKPATASSQQSGNTAAMGNDGQTSTRWSTNDPSTEQWWKVDLGAQYDVTGSKMTWESASGTMKYRIEVSSDGQTWNETVNKWDTPVTQSVTEDTWSANHVKFIKVTALGINPAWAGFREFEAYGAKSTVVDTTALEAAIAAAQFKADKAVVGNQPGQYPQTAVEALKTAIAAAQDVVDTAKTQAEVTAAIEVLQAAVKAFDDAKITGEEPAEVDTTALEAAIAAAQVKVDKAVVGDQPGQYPQ